MYSATCGLLDWITSTPVNYRCSDFWVYFIVSILYAAEDLASRCFVIGSLGFDRSGPSHCYVWPRISDELSWYSVTKHFHQGTSFSPKQTTYECM